MFDILKEEFKANTAKMQQIRAAHEKKEQEIRDVYAPGKIPQFLHEEEENYKSAMKKARLDAINRLNSTVGKLEAQQGGMTATIDTELLATLNAVSNSGMGLTAAELRELGEKVLASGSSICARKLSEIAEESGISLTMPDPEKAKSVLYEAAEKMMSFYRNYDGTDKYKEDMPIDESKYYFMSDGKFLDDYGEKYKLASTSNLARVKKAVAEAEKSKYEKTVESATEQFQKMIHADDLPEKKPSEAAAFAKAYSERMCPQEKALQPQVEFMRPSPGIACKRVPHPKPRPNLTYNTTDTAASTAAKELSERAFLLPSADELGI
ncbi:hypothetical protein [Blautia glucerasea]|uniref:hypothetical protein n=1 Tax=Blautia glucerasea TaxID=536633 RepID=UPI00156E1EFE|nr:hypothetical protein [Blautia glucerasea]NSL03870.1 hypothetical protein [Blautia glucerasea]